jgi:hypothetical protein
MNQKTIQDITQEVYRRFPEVRGKKPKVRAMETPKSRSITRSSVSLLTFQGQAVTSSGKTMPYYVRVVANEHGRILKITMSH